MADEEETDPRQRRRSRGSSLHRDPKDGEEAKQALDAS